MSRTQGDHKVTKIVMTGACGRMGQSILRLAAQDKVFQISGGVEQKGHPDLGRDIGDVLGFKKTGAQLICDVVQASKGADVIIDFTHPSSLDKHLSAATKNKTGLVVGTTGLTDAHRHKLKIASKQIAIIQSPNMSVGVNLLFKLTELAAEVLDESYDMEISEIHHKLKKDAPSGTAVKLLEILAAVKKRNLKTDAVYGREGEVGARKQNEIGCFALSGGDVVGEHHVFFFGAGERVELVHQATSRDAFAKGALVAARFLTHKTRGLFTMQDVLGMA